MKDMILKKAAALSKKQITWRRHLHQYPELSNQEFKTTAYIKDILKKNNITIKKIDLPTGIIAEVVGKKKGPTVAVRTDIDALPVLEQTTLPFKSKNIGCMHACGHDVHMSTVTGVAILLNEIKEHLNGTVRFIFQPAEEMPPGGARPMIESGALEDVKMIFGLHVDPFLKKGKIGLRDGVSMASVSDFNLKIIGKGGHAAQPHNAVDAIVTAAEVVESLQKIISREIDPVDPVVITFGKINGGSARNVICDEVTLVGTARTLSVKASKAIPGKIKKVAESICKARGAQVEMEIVASYPVLINHPQANRLLRESFESLFGKGKIEPTEQTLGGEDFACYLEKVRGAMFRLGVMNNKIGANKSWHSPLFVVDEDAIYYGTSTIAATVYNYLSKA